MVTPDAKRKAVAHLVEVHQVSQRRACAALNVDRSTVRYQSRRADDTDLRDAMKAVAKDRRRFGYRRLHVMVERQGLRSSLRDLETEEADLINTRDGLIEEVESFTASRDQIQNSVATLSERRDALDREIEELRNDKLSISGDVDGLRRVVESLERRQSELSDVEQQLSKGRCNDDIFI